MFLSVIEYHYRGWCNQASDNKQNDEYFCRSGANFSFITVTIYIPIFGLVLLYLPSIIYIIVIIIKRKNRQMLDFYYGVIFFIFSIVTNMSVFGENSLKENGNNDNEIPQHHPSSILAQPRRVSLDLNPRKKMPGHGSKMKSTRSLSLPNLPCTTSQPTILPASLPAEHGQDCPAHSDTEDIFSLHQSNVLYSLFIFCTISFFIGDIVLQVLRKRSSEKTTILGIAPITWAALSCTLLNKALWINFNWDLNQNSNNRWTFCNQPQHSTCWTGSIAVGPFFSLNIKQ